MIEQEDFTKQEKVYTINGKDRWYISGYCGSPSLTMRNHDTGEELHFGIGGLRMSVFCPLDNLTRDGLLNEPFIPSFQQIDNSPKLHAAYTLGYHDAMNTTNDEAAGKSKTFMATTVKRICDLERSLRGKRITHGQAMTLLCEIQRVNRTIRSCSPDTCDSVDVPRWLWDDMTKKCAAYDFEHQEQRHEDDNDTTEETLP